MRCLLLFALGLSQIAIAGAACEGPRPPAWSTGARSNAVPHPSASMEDPCGARAAYLGKAAPIVRAECERERGLRLAIDAHVTAAQCESLMQMRASTPLPSLRR